MRFRRVIVGISIVGVVGCAPAPPPASPNGPTSSAPATADPRFARTRYSTVWSDPGGIDLMSPEGTFVRASVESLDVSAVNGMREAAAPGFWASLTGAASDEAAQFFDMGPAETEFGVKRFEVLDRREDGAVVTVTVCAHRQQVGHEANPGYEFGAVTPRAQVLTFERTGPTAPVARQSGRESHADDAAVFGTWRTTGWVRGRFPAGDPCVGRPLPGVSAAEWPTTGAPRRMAALPREPDYPGWPNGVGA